MDLDIPEVVMTHPSMERIRSMAAESLVLGNVSNVYSHSDNDRVSD
jgi:hypothetical protein